MSVYEVMAEICVVTRKPMRASDIARAKEHIDQLFGLLLCLRRPLDDEEREFLRDMMIELETKIVKAVRGFNELEPEFWQLRRQVFQLYIQRANARKIAC